MIDYRKILVAYINEVIEAEGVDFLSHEEPALTHTLQHFSGEEYAALLEASLEAPSLDEEDREKRRESIAILRGDKS